MDLPKAVAIAARRGDIEAVRDWLAAGGAPDAVRENGKETLLSYACMSSRPSCASVVEILCAAGGPDGRGLGYATMHGAVDAVRVLLRYGAPVSAATTSHGMSALHLAVTANRWKRYIDPWTIAHAQAAASIGHHGVVRLLLRRGAAVDAITTTSNMTPLMIAARFSGFISLGVVKELLSCGADLDLVNAKGRNAEAIARRKLSYEIYTGEGIPRHPEIWRRRGVVEAFLDLCAAVRAAGSWKRYANAPRIDVIVLQRLCAAGRASPPPAFARLFPTSTKSQPLPREMVWHILSFWRTDRDP